MPSGCNRKMTTEKDPTLLELVAMSPQTDQVSNVASVSSSHEQWDVKGSHEDPSNFAEEMQHTVITFLSQYRSRLRRMVALSVLALYCAYVICACLYSMELAQPLLIITAVVFALWLYGYIRDTYGGRIDSCCCAPCSAFINRRWHVIKW